MKAYIDPKKCIGCGAYIPECPAGAILMRSGWRSEVQRDRCVGCGRCVEICHRQAPKLLGEEPTSDHE